MTISLRHRLEGITEIYLPENESMAGHTFPGPCRLPPELEDVATNLSASAQKHDEIDFTVTVEDISFRAHRMPTSNGPMLIFRQIPQEIWNLDRCGLPDILQKTLLSKRLNQGGLVLVAGKPGNGKTMTVAALIKERLMAHSGICITVEDPVEMPLQGQHGRGFCLQRGVASQEDYAGAVRDAMRAYPTQVNSILMIGEVRDPQTAMEALRASVDGRLVLTTMHAGDPVQAMHRILSLASHAVGVHESRGLLAAGFRMVLHQRLNSGRLYVNAMLDTQKVTSIIGNSRLSLELLRNELDTQHNQMKMGYTVVVRDH